MGRTIEKPVAVRRLEGLYRRYHRRVRWVLRGRGISDQELDDVVHDVFLAIHRRYADRDPRLAEELWVIGVARNVAFAYRRGHARRLRLLDDVPEPAPGLTPDEELARREAWLALHAFLDTLHEDQREAFVLMDLLGMATAEIAEVTGAPANTVSSRVRLARRRFDKRFTGLGGHEAAFLRSAGMGERPSPQQRQRTWAGIVAAVPLPAAPWTAAPPAGASITKWAIGSAVATTLAIGAYTQLGDPAPADSPGSRTVTATSASSHAGPSRSRGHEPMPPIEMRVETGRNAAATPPTTPPPDSGTLEAAAPSDALTLTSSTTRETSWTESSSKPGRAGPDRAGDRSRTTEATDLEAKHALSEAVTLLRIAEARLAAGDSAAALATIDTYRERFDPGPLHRDRLRIERRAACAAGQTARARDAHAELVRLQLASTHEPDCP